MTTVNPRPFTLGEAVRHALQALDMLGPESGVQQSPGAPTSREAALVQTLQAILGAFNSGDLDRVLDFFADDCVLEMHYGTAPWGSRYVGKDAVRHGLRTYFNATPELHYGDDTHFVVGDLGVSKWTLRATSAKGERIEARGCDFYTFRDGKIVEKDSYLKVRDNHSPRMGR
jgi:ketosteroid isomerase-like protein